MRPSAIICYNCHATGHYSPDCNLKFKDYQSIILKYESLNAEDKVRVTCKSYNQAHRLIDVDNESKIAATIKPAEQKSRCGYIAIYK